MFGKLTAGLIGGVLLGVFLVPLLGLAAAQLSISLENHIAIVFVTILVVTAFFAVRASRPARAWRFTLIAAGCAGLLLSFWHLTASGTPSANTTDVHIGAAGIISFFAGVVLLLGGFLLGREELT